MSLIDALIRRCCCEPGDAKSSCCLLDSQYWRNTYYLRVAGLDWSERTCYSNDPAFDCTNPLTHVCCWVNSAALQIDGAVFRQPFAAASPDFDPCGQLNDPLCCPDQVNTPGVGCECPDPWVQPNIPASPFGSRVNSTYRSGCCENIIDYFDVRYTGTLTIEEAAGDCDQTIDGVPVAFPATNEPIDLRGRAAIVCINSLDALGFISVGSGGLSETRSVLTDPCLDESIVPASPFPLHALVIEPAETLSIDNYIQYGQGPLTWSPPTLIYIARLTREISPPIGEWRLMYAAVPTGATRDQDGNDIMPFCSNLFDPANDPCWQTGYYPGPCPEDLGSFQPIDPVGPAESGCDPSNEDNCVGCYDITLDKGTLTISTVPFQD